MNLACTLPQSGLSRRSAELGIGAHLPPSFADGWPAILPLIEPLPAPIYYLPSLEQQRLLFQPLLFLEDGGLGAGAGRGGGVRRVYVSSATRKPLGSVNSTGLA